MSVRKSWVQEMESAFLYEVLADSDRSAERRALFGKLAGEARAQAAIWATELRKVTGEDPGAFTPSVRARFVAALVRRLGPARLRSVLAGMKVRGMSVFRQGAASVFRQGAAGDAGAGAHLAGHQMPRSVEEIGKRHHEQVGGDNLRPAVFGASDGLNSNLCLILGVAGASANGHAVLITGVAGLLAGALSMAAGEYVSVLSQREMFEHQIGAERDELKQYPEQEAAELSLIYQARGLSKEDADRTASHLIATPELALDTLAREELGLDPGALGSPASSFASFAVGAAIPLAPFFITTGRGALVGAVLLTAAALFGVGCAISLFTGRGALRSGARLLLIGGAAGVVTYAIGRLVGSVV
jgi:vacuolar iron transporter family protein